MLLTNVLSLAAEEHIFLRHADGGLVTLDLDLAASEFDLLNVFSAHLGLEHLRKVKERESHFDILLQTENLWFTTGEVEDCARIEFMRRLGS